MSPSCEQLAPLNCTSDQLQVEPSTNQLTSSTPNLHVLPTASTLFASPAELNNDLASGNTVQSSQCQQQNPQQKQLASKPLFGPWNVNTNRNNASVHGEENTVFAGGGEDDGYGKGAQGISAWRQISVKCRGRGDGRGIMRACDIIICITAANATFLKEVLHVGTQLLTSLILFFSLSLVLALPPNLFSRSLSLSVSISVVLSLSFSLFL